MADFTYEQLLLEFEQQLNRKLSVEELQFIMWIKEKYDTEYWVKINRIPS